MPPQRSALRPLLAVGISIVSVLLLSLSSISHSAATNSGGHAPAPPLAPAHNFYFGNLHSHTSYSDGSGTPEEAYKFARDTGGLDFLAITEHNHASAESSAGERRDGLLIATDHSLYEKLKTAANNINESGKFVAIYGQEFSSISKGNHSNVFMAKKVIETANGDYRKVFTDAWMDEHGVELIELNHPWDGERKNQQGNDVPILPADVGAPRDSNYGRNKFANVSDFVDAVDGRATLVEVMNGPALTNANPNNTLRVASKQPGYYIAYLNIGLHLAPTADQDNHWRTWGTITEARTVVLASALNRTEILKALKERHVYASEDKDLKIEMTIKEAIMGSRLPAVSSGSTVPIRIVIRDGDDPDGTYRVRLYYDAEVGGPTAQVIETKTIKDGDTLKFDPKPTQGRGYYFIEVTGMSGGNKGYQAWTAPVWFE